jgi:uncharacterized membrane protein
MNGPAPAARTASIAPFEIRRGEPGCRRNQLIVPRPGVVQADVEDDFHNFRVEIRHDGERVLELRTLSVRAPWTTCPTAGEFLAERMTGQRLDSLAEVDSPLLHCTHQYDIALLAAAHALDTQPTLYSSFVSDRQSPTRTAELYRNGRLELAWEIVDGQIVSPGIGHGESLRKLSTWSADLPPDQREAARVLRRSAFIWGGRIFDYTLTPTADKVVQTTGGCYTFQPVRSAQSVCTMRKLDFTDGGVPLRDRIEEAMG